MSQVKKWIAPMGLMFAVFFLMSSAGVYIRANHFPDYVPRIVAVVLDGFIAPGLAVWWLTIGGVFSGFPIDVAGYSVAIIANTILWFGFAVLLAFIVRASRRLFD